MKKKIEYSPQERKWYTCPHCGAKLAAFDKQAISEDVFIKCRICKNEIEIVIK